MVNERFLAIRVVGFWNKLCSQTKVLLYLQLYLRFNKAQQPVFAKICLVTNSTDMCRLGERSMYVSNMVTKDYFNMSFRRKNYNIQCKKTF